MSDIYQAPKAQLQEKQKNGDWGSVESAVAGDYELRPMQILEEAWETLKGLKTPILLGYLCLFVVSAVLEVVNFGVISGGDFSSFGEEPELAPAQLGMSVLISLLSAFITLPMSVGLYMMGVKHSVGVSARAGEVFNYFPKALKLFLNMIAYYVLVLIGTILLILPGIYLAITLSMSFLLIVEKDMSIGEALSVSRKALHHKFFSFLGFILLCILVVILGALALLIGLIWAIPLTTLMGGILYRNVFGVEDQTLAQ